MNDRYDPNGLKAVGAVLMLVLILLAAANVIAWIVLGIAER